MKTNPYTSFIVPLLAMSFFVSVHRGVAGDFLEFRFQFDTDTGALVDTSGNGLQDLLTPTNGPAHRFEEPSLVGGSGSSIGLDAPGNGHTTGSYLLVNDPPHPDSFSFSIWIKPDKPSQQNPLFSRENVWWPSPGVFYSLSINPSGSLVWITGRNQNIETDPGLIVDGEIHHIVVTHADSDGPDTFQTDRGRLYVNGVMVAEVENPTEVPTLEANMDGSDIYRLIWLGTKSSGPGYKGELDDFQMYSAELTPEQVAQMYREPGSIAGSGPSFAITSIIHDSGTGEVSISWESQPGMRYNLLSVTDPSSADPQDWPVYGGNTDIIATPNINTLTIPPPPESERFFVIEEFPPPPVTIFEDNFDGRNVLDPWTNASPDGNPWELGVPTAGLGPLSAFSPPNAVGTVLAGNYVASNAVDTHVVSSLRSPAISLSGIVSGTISYQRYLDMESPQFDFATVNLLDATDDSLIEELETDIGNVSLDWETVSYNIPAAAIGKDVYFEIVFSSDNFDSLQSGLVIDDFKVEGLEL
jgi:hypothetical protein